METPAPAEDGAACPAVFTAGDAASASVVRMVVPHPTAKAIIKAQPQNSLLIDINRRAHRPSAGAPAIRAYPGDGVSNAVAGNPMAPSLARRERRKPIPAAVWPRVRTDRGKYGVCSASVLLEKDLFLFPIHVNVFCGDFVSVA